MNLEIAQSLVGIKYYTIYGNLTSSIRQVFPIDFYGHSKRIIKFALALPIVCSLRYKHRSIQLRELIGKMRFFPLRIKSPLIKYLDIFMS